MKRAFPFLLVAAAACNHQPAESVRASAPAAVRVPVLTVSTRPFTATVAVTGTLVSRNQVDVKAETTGRVLRFPKQEGESVEAGEPVLWINDEDYRLGIRHARSAVQVSEAALERARVLASHNAAEVERARNLITSGGITDRDLKAAEIADRDARAQVTLAAAQLEQAASALQIAEKRQRDTIIHAPVSGEIQKRFVNPGAYVEPPTAVFTLVDNQSLELESPVPSSDLAQVRVGSPVSFRVNAYPDTTFAGKVIEINPSVDSMTRSARVRIAVANPGRRLRAGMFAEGEIQTGIESHAIVVPAAAVYRDDRSARDSFVYVVENDKAARRAVRIGRERDNELVIASGLKAGDLLIAEQSIEIADGVAVEARK